METTTRPVTDEEYLKDPSLCPVCRSTQTNQGLISFYDADGYRHYRCIYCGAHWIENYKMVGYTLVSY
jgi:formate dehydrogenase maturation protein FdhE